MFLYLLELLETYTQKRQQSSKIISTGMATKFRVAAVNCKGQGEYKEVESYQITRGV